MVSHFTEELIWLNEREEEEIAFDWSDSNPNMSAKRELYGVSAGSEPIMMSSHPAERKRCHAYLD